DQVRFPSRSVSPASGLEGPPPGRATARRRHSRKTEMGHHVEEAVDRGMAFAQGVERGAEIERGRIAAILNLPEAKGLERAAIAAALSAACSTEAARDLFAPYASPP